MRLVNCLKKTPITGVCDTCAPGLKQTIKAFKALKHHIPGYGAKEVKE